MKNSCEVCLPKIYPIATFKPSSFIFLVFFYWKYRYLHAFFIIVGLFDHIHDGKRPQTLFNVPETKKKPNVITVGVYVVLYHQKMLSLLWNRCKSPTKISTLKVCIDTILKQNFRLFTFLLQLFKHFMIVVCYWIDR